MGAQADGQSWQELPFWTLVKNYLKSAGVGALVMYILTRAFSWDIVLWNIQMENMWLFIPEFTIFFGTVWIWNWSRASERRKRQKQARNELRAILKNATAPEKKS